MNDEIQVVSTPEEEELREKRREFTELEAQLIEREEKLASLEYTLEMTQQRYLHVVGRKLAQLDELNAQITECLAELYPAERVYRSQAQEARQKAEESAKATSDVEFAATAPPHISDDTKKLYRRLARAVHPDLAKDDQDRDRRTQTMIDVNDAYRSGDVARLSRILADWESSPDRISGDGVGADLVRIIRQIARMKRRLAVLDSEILELQQSPSYDLHKRIQAATEEGRDLLQEMAEDLGGEIERKQHQLSQLQMRMQQQRTRS